MASVCPAISAFDLLVSAALQAVPISHIPWPAAETGVYESEAQEQLCAQLQLSASLYGPPPSRLRCAFLKAYASRCSTVSEALIETQAAAMARQEHSQGWRVYRFATAAGGQAVVATEETAALIAHGTTGLHTWPAALALAELAAAQPQLLRGRRLVELGAGPGLAGLAVAKVAAPRSLLLTDCHEAVMALLARNIYRNVEHSQDEDGTDLSAGFVHSCDGGHLVPVELAPLLWGLAQDRVLLDDTDMLIGSDLVYDPDLLPGLVDTLAYFLRAGLYHQSSRDLDAPTVQRQVLLASTQRNPSTYAAFRASLQALQPHITVQVLDWSLKDCQRIFDRSCGIVEVLLISESTIPPLNLDVGRC